MALPFLKESINLFHLFHIFMDLDVNAMFLFLISLFTRQYMIMVKKILWLSMGEWTSREFVILELRWFISWLLFSLMNVLVIMKSVIK